MSEIIIVQRLVNGAVVEQTEHNPNNIAVIYQSDEGKIKNGNKLKRARINDKMVINNEMYDSVLEGIFNNYPEELKHIERENILIIVNDQWEPSNQTTVNSDRPATLAKATGLFKTIMGYQYIITLKGYYLERFKDCQVAAMVLAQLLSINPTTGTVKKLSVDEIPPITATFGAHFLSLSENIDFKNVAEERVEFHEAERADGQISAFDPGEFEQDPEGE